MDIKEYIASGVVELYVMGALSPSEREEFERMLSIHPELKDELDSVESAMETFANANAVKPRAELKSKIIHAAIKNEQSGKVIPLHKPFLDFRIAASITVALLAAASAVFFYSKWSSAEKRYASLVAERDQMASEINQVKYSYQNALNGITILRDLNTKTIALVATDSSRTFHARVYWNSQSHEAFIDVQQLPVPASDKQYQLWALVDGKPVDAGVFNVSDSTFLQRVKDIDRADAWAVTLEPAGGSATPHLDQMYLISKNS